jgi:hypothetical protein
VTTTATSREATISPSNCVGNRRHFSDEFGVRRCRSYGG